MDTKNQFEFEIVLTLNDLTQIFLMKQSEFEISLSAKIYDKKIS